jgi:hypothetical protein
LLGGLELNKNLGLTEGTFGHEGVYVMQQRGLLSYPSFLSTAKKIHHHRSPSFPLPWPTAAEAGEAAAAAKTAGAGAAARRRRGHQRPRSRGGGKDRGGQRSQYGGGGAFQGDAFYNKAIRPTRDERLGPVTSSTGTPPLGS